MPSNTDQVTATIQSLAFGGSFVGTIEDGAEHLLGKKIFVREVAPGEKIKALVTKDHKRFVEGKLLSILSGPDIRTTPKCSVFGACGGCDLQHLNISAQRKSKLEMVTQTLKLKANMTPLEGLELIGGELPEYHYRNRVSLHINPSGQIGFYRAGSGDIVDITDCPLADNKINNAIFRLRPFLKSLAPILNSVTIEVREAGVILIFNLESNSKVKQIGKEIPKIFEPIVTTFKTIQVIECEKTLLNTIPTSILEAGRFSQVNNYANKLLIECVTSNCRDSKITELYAGSGNFTFQLSKNSDQIEAVELDAVLVKSAREKIKQLGLSKKINFHSISVEQYVKKNKLLDCIILDPPRNGVKNIIPNIIKSTSNNLIYVSCNLPSLCRDLRELSLGGFILKKIYLIDMFPQTHHVETVSILSR